MANRAVPFAPGEWFHCYTRGIEGRATFETPADYGRFLQSLYLCNSRDPVRRDDLDYKPFAEVFRHSRSSTIVDMGAYCLMPNHFHILLRAKEDGGVARFMQKLGTAYTMYFNVGRKHVGPIFVGPFRAKHVGKDRYFRRVAQYIHLNPVELFEPKWKTGSARRNLAVIERKLRAYQYSSLPNYLGVRRPEDAILDRNARNLIKVGLPSLASALDDAAQYYELLA